MEAKKNLTTAELACALGVQGATIRRALCTDGNYLGLRPIKLPNRRLLWPASGLDQILGPDAPTQAD